MTTLARAPFCPGFAKRALALAMLAVVFVALLSSPALAHRVNVFAWLDGSELVVESSFSRGQKVEGGRVEVFAVDSGRLLLTGRTDAQGLARFPVPPEAQDHDLRIVVQAGQGHRNEWLLPAGQYAAGPTSPAPATSDPASSRSDIANGQTVIQISPAELEGLIEAALEAKLAPLRQTLASQAEQGPGLRDIIGGLGWVMGLLGIALYFRSRAGRV